MSDRRGEAIDANQHLMESIFRWLEIRREEEDQDLWLERVQLMIDAEHSRLLWRIYFDEEVFPEPPPTMYASPCYELREGERIGPVDGGPTNLSKFADEELYSAGQNIFVVTHKFSDEDVLVLPTHKRGPYYRLWKGSDEERVQTRPEAHRWFIELYGFELPGEE